MAKSVENKKSYKWVASFVAVVVVCAVGSHIKENHDRKILIEGFTPVNTEYINETISREPVTVNVNTATVQELCMVPGMTPRLARNIVDLRDALGGITDIDDVQDVPGISKTVFDEIGAYLTVE